MVTGWKWLSHEAALTYALPLSAFLLALLILLAARHSIMKWLLRHAQGQAIGQVAIDTLRLPSLLWAIAAAVHVGLALSIIPEKYAERGSKAILSFLVASACLVAASVLVRALTLTGRRRGIAAATAGLAQTLIRVFIFTAGAAAVLSIYNVNIRPLLAALGVGGLAVALALQDTLSNFFAGIHILVEEPISLGAYIRLASGEEGVVTDIGWRTTRVRNGSNNIVVIPNTKITSGILVNFNLPDTKLMADVTIVAGYDADVDQIRRIALEETRACEGVLPVPAPQVFFNPGVTPTHLQFAVVFAVADYSRKGPLQSEARLRIFRRMRAEGVPLPAPSTDMKILAD